MRWLLPGALALVAAGPGCGAPAPRTSGDATGRAEEAREIRSRKCSKCHAPPEPAKHARAELEVIFGRHRSRTKLDPDQWAAMVDLLARPDETPGAR